MSLKGLRQQKFILHKSLTADVHNEYKQFLNQKKFTWISYLGLSLFNTTHCNHERINYHTCFKISAVFHSTVTFLAHPGYTQIN